MKIEIDRNRYPENYVFTSGGPLAASISIRADNSYYNNSTSFYGSYNPLMMIIDDSNPREVKVIERHNLVVNDDGEIVKTQGELNELGYWCGDYVDTLHGVMKLANGYMVKKHYPTICRALDVDEKGNRRVVWNIRHHCIVTETKRFLTKEYSSRDISVYVKALTGPNKKEYVIKKHCERFITSDDEESLAELVNSYRSIPDDSKSGITNSILRARMVIILRYLGMPITDELMEDYKTFEREVLVDNYNFYLLKAKNIKTHWYDRRKVSVVRDIDGRSLLASEAICIMDEKGHKKFFNASQISAFDLAGLIQTYTSLNIERGGRKLGYNELEFFNTYIKRFNKFKEANYLGQRITYFEESELERAKKEIDLIARSKQYMVEGNRLLKVANVLGGGRISVPQPFTLAQRSKSTLKTGKIGYSFGVEFETSAGDLTDDKCRVLGLSKQGDGSILANEFVTRPLHGDHGIEMIRTYTDVLSQSCAVTDRDSIHVHVGGDNGIDIPIYNQLFSINAIKLASQVEDELFSIVPKHRRENRYCKSVSSFMSEFSQSVTSDDRLLYSYIFQRTGSFDKTWNRGRDDMSKWCNGRYKWLNLVNCNTRNGNSRGQSFKTVEFRLFPGSLDFEAVKKYIQLSLAFVWFVENKQKRIKDGDVSLGEIVDTSIRTNTEAIPLLEFIDHQKQLYS